VFKFPKTRSVATLLGIGTLALMLGCSGGSDRPLAPARPDGTTTAGPYRIGTGDELKFFVWGDRSLSETVLVRPDGRVSLPLIEDVLVANRTPTEVGREVEEQLKKYVEEPLVTVIVTGFVGSFAQQVRVVGEAAKPQAVLYRADLSLLDVLIEVGGLTEFADGNRATLIRGGDGAQTEYRVRLDDLLRDGDISANVYLQPGDVLIVPESFF